MSPPHSSNLPWSRDTDSFSPSPLPPLCLPSPCSSVMKTNFPKLRGVGRGESSLFLEKLSPTTFSKKKNFYSAQEFSIAPYCHQFIYISNIKVHFNLSYPELYSL